MDRAVTTCRLPLQTVGIVDIQQLLANLDTMSRPPTLVTIPPSSALFEPTACCADTPYTAPAPVLPTPVYFSFCRSPGKHGNNPQTVYGP